MYKSLALIAALALGCFASANADTVTGGVQIAGNTVTWSTTPGDTVLTFSNPTSGSAIGSGTLSAITGGTIAFENSFNYGTVAVDTTLFQVTETAGGSTTIGWFDVYTVDAGSGVFFNPAGTAFLNVSGEGTLNEWNSVTGFDQAVDGTFSISSQSTGSGSTFTTTDVSFSAGAIANSPVPEPESLALFGTGLLGIVGIARRKFSV